MITDKEMIEWLQSKSGYKEYADYHGAFLMESYRLMLLESTQREDALIYNNIRLTAQVNSALDALEKIKSYQEQHGEHMSHTWNIANEAISVYSAEKGDKCDVLDKINKKVKDSFDRNEPHTNAWITQLLLVRNIVNSFKEKP